MGDGWALRHFADLERLLSAIVKSSPRASCTVHQFAWIPTKHGLCSLPLIKEVEAHLVPASF